jgi:hypothetical protein
VTLRSEYGVGSTFTVYLPLHTTTYGDIASTGHETSAIIDSEQ